MKKINSFVKKIGNLKPFTYFILVFIALFVFQFLLFPKMLKSNYIYAEDGGVFTSDELRFGPGSLFIPFGGYLVMLSRLFGLITIGVAKFFNNFNVVPHVIAILGALFVSFTASYFASDRFEFLIKGRLRRFLVSGILILFVSQYIGMLFNFVGIHWWCGIFMFLVSLEMLHGNLPSKLVYPAIIISILSSPSSLVIAFAALYFIFAKYKEKSLKTLLQKKYLFYFVMIFICLAVQAYFMLFRTNVSTLSGSTSIDHVKDAVGNAYMLSLDAPFSILSRDFYQGFLQNIGAYVLGGFIWLVIIWYAQKKKLLKYAFFSIICVVFVYFMVFYKTPEGNMWFQHYIVTVYPNHFYHVVPSVATLLLILAIIFKNTKKEYMKYIVAALAILAVQFYCIRWMPELKNNLELRDANEHLDFNSKTYAVVKTAPYEADDWWTYTRVPVNPEYCNKEGIICETFND